MPLFWPSVTELSQRLLVSVRTSTAVLDQALRRAANTVGGAPPSLIARFKNSLNRGFHNISVSQPPDFVFTVTTTCSQHLNMQWK